VAIRKSKFDWSSINRYELAEYVWSAYPKVVNKEMSLEKFHRIVGTHIKNYIPIKLKKWGDNKVENNYVWVGGTYYSDLDKQKEKSIELVLVYKSRADTIKITSKNFHRSCHTITNTIMHELIHMRQYRRRKFKDLPAYKSTAEKTEQREEQTYLGCSDEIDAYSFNIACELLYKFQNDTSKVIDYLNKDQKGLRGNHNSWRMYLKAFNHDHEHPIIKRVKQKVVRYLPNALYGKPYRNRDWIRY
jgi:hypothetical protein